MRLRILTSFGDKLNDQVEYIAKDKPAVARKFNREVIKRIKGIPKMPYANRKSIQKIRPLMYLDLRNMKMIRLKSNYWRYY